MKESSNEGGSSDAAMLTSLRASPAKSRTRREDEKKQDEEEEASNRVSPPLQDEGVAHVVAETREVLAIKVDRTRAEPSEGIRTLPTKEEAEEDKDEEGDGTVSDKLVTSAKLDQGLVEVSLLPRSVCEADLFLQVLSCNA